MAELVEISHEKVLANRQNSLSSTGPVTVAGKQKSRWNALKHGLLSREIIVQVGDSPESKREFAALHTALRTDCNPVGTIEEMLVERIAVSYWRLSRCVRAESGEIGKATVGKTQEMYRLLAEEVESIGNRMFDEFRFSSYRKTSFGLMHVIKHLENLKDELQTVDDFDDNALTKLMEIYGKAQNSLPFGLKVITLISKEANQQQPADTQCKKRRKKDVSVKVMHEMIDREIGRCKEMLSKVSPIEDELLQCRLQSAAVPNQEASEKLLRYESAIERQLYKALDQLERLQRHRKGDFVPPPAQLGLSVDH